jgi:DNA-binding transcriptional LysR family regulator
MLDLAPQLLGAFLTVAEIGKVNRAALMLNRTQTSARLQIRKLENLIGTELFKRSSSGLVRKPSGEQLVPHRRACASRHC